MVPVLSRRSFLRSASAVALACAASEIAFAAPEGGRRVSGPFTHENLSIYLVHGRSAPGPVPLTLAEAMASRKTVVHETGDVSQLAIENVGEQPVFVQAGDIVKGGKQDRVLTVSLVLPPKSGRMPIAAYCVEQGRWQARGREDVSRFETTTASLPSREAKLAMKVAQAGGASIPAPTDGRGGARTAVSAQGKVWDSVAQTQAKLARAVGQPVKASESETSMQLTLENAKVRTSQADYAKALAGMGEEGDDVVGYVFAVNGKINSADLYPSNGLFRKMWRKNFEASVTEALAAKADAAGPPPAAEAVLAFLDDAENGASSARDVTKQVKLETREGAGAFLFETRAGAAAYAHRNYLAK